MEMSPEDEQKIMALVRERMQELLQVCASTAERIEPMVEASKECGLTVQLFLYRCMDEILDAAADLSKMMNVNMPICAERANKIMLATMQDSTSMFGYTFKPDTKPYFNVKVDDKPKMLAWMKAHPIGNYLVKEEVHHAAFGKFMKENFTDQGNEPPSFVGVFNKPSLVVRKNKA